VPPCKVDSTTSTGYAKLVARLTASDAALEGNLAKLQSGIEADYTVNGDCVPRLKYPEIVGKIWKYRVGSAGGGKRGGHRVIGFLREPGKMYLIFIYEAHKERDDVTREEYRTLVRKLEADIMAPSAPALPDAQSGSASTPPAS
jgi:hypothetical protein